MTKQTKQTYEMKMRQGRETEEMIERQRNKENATLFKPFFFDHLKQ